MDKTTLQHTRIRDLVDQNSVRAFVLHYFGIQFYQYSEQTLEQVCSEKGLKVEAVVRELESPGENFRDADLPLVTYPVDLILEYLKHSHFLFVKHKLPYLSSLVENFHADHPDYKVVEKDLKMVLPLFVEDFIHHIYEEEDSLFVYIRILDQALKGKVNPSRLFYQMERNSIQRYAMDHEFHDEEMKGIRKITRDFHLTLDAPLHMKVIYAELISLEDSFHTHARIENQILFPKVMALENQVRTMCLERTRWN